MKKLTTILLIVMTLLASDVSFAASQANTRHEALQVQVIKDQFDFSKSSFKSVKLGSCAINRCTIDIELTPNAAKKLNDIMTNHVELLMNLVWHDHILSASKIKSAVGAKFRVANVNELIAKNFIKAMNS